MKKYVITRVKHGMLQSREYVSNPMTLEEAIEYYSYTLECGASWSHEKGNKKINRNPTTIKSLISNLNNAEMNTNGALGSTYSALQV